MLKNKKLRVYANMMGNAINATAWVAPRMAGRMALDIFCRPVSGKLREKDTVFLSAAESHSLRANGMHVQVYEWAGADGAPTVLLAHGWASNAARWRQLLPILREKGYRIIALDAPAHGASGSKRFHMLHYSRFVSVVMQQFKPDIAIGHSIGAATLVHYLHHNPTLPSLKKLIMLAPPSELSTMTDNFFTTLHLSDRTQRGYSKHFERRFGFNVADLSIAKFAQTVLVPSLVIHDPSDRVAPYSEGKHIAENLPNGQLLTTTGNDHHLHGKVVQQAILDFLS